jgi:hypothetical protein
MTLASYNNKQSINVPATAHRIHSQRNPIKALSEQLEISFSIILKSSPDLHLGYANINLISQCLAKDNMHPSRGGWISITYNLFLCILRRLEIMYKYKLCLLEIKNKLNILSVVRI